MTTVATYPPEVVPLVEELLGGVRETLGDNESGVI